MTSIAENIFFTRLCDKNAPIVKSIGASVEKVIGKKSGEDTATGDTKKTRKKINTSKRPAVERHRNDWAVDL